jgi:hypothetical protein
MASPISKIKEKSAITHHQKFEGHTNIVWGEKTGETEIVQCGV